MTLRGRKRKTFSCVPGQKAEGTKTKRVFEKRPLNVSLPRPPALKKFLSYERQKQKKKEREDALPFSSPFTSPIVATFPVENLTAPGLIDTSSTPSPALLSPPVCPSTHASFSFSLAPLLLSLDCSHFPPFRSSSPLGLLLVSSTQRPNLAFAHARLDSRPCFAQSSFR